MGRGLSGTTAAPCCSLCGRRLSLATGSGRVPGFVWGKALRCRGCLPERAHAKRRAAMWESKEGRWECRVVYYQQADGKWRYEVAEVLLEGRPPRVRAARRWRGESPGGAAWAAAHPCLELPAGMLGGVT